MGLERTLDMGVDTITRGQYYAAAKARPCTDCGNLRESKSLAPGGVCKWCGSTVPEAVTKARKGRH